TTLTILSFSFFKPSRPKTPQEVAKAINDSLPALDIQTVVEVKALKKALEEVEKNFTTMKCMISGDGETEPNMDHVSQLAFEICKEGVLDLLIHKLPILGWEVFVANPHKPQEVKLILAKNHEKLTDLLHNLSAGKGNEDEQFEEEKELIIKEIERVSQLVNL
ncbi:hypothetical protein C1H46_026689, partial [Malus baccata]